jgi:hypothetical protein
VTRPRLRRLAPLLVAALGVAVLSGCTPARAGSAAIVGNESLSQATLNQQALDVVSLVNQSGQAAPNIAGINQAIVGSWVTQRVLGVIAAEHHVTVSDADVSSFLDKAIQSAGGTDKLDQLVAAQNSTPPQLIPELVRFYLLSRALPKALLPNGTSTEQNAALLQAVDETATRLGVHVNPRYGQWDSKTGTVGPEASGLSTPATKIDGQPIVTPGGGGFGGLPAPGAP